MARQSSALSLLRSIWLLTKDEKTLGEIESWDRINHSLTLLNYWKAANFCNRAISKQHRKATNKPWNESLKISKRFMAWALSVSMKKSMKMQKTILNAL